MDTVKYCVSPAAMWNADLMCVDLKEKLPKIPLKMKKEKYHSDLLAFTLLKKKKTGNRTLKKRSCKSYVNLTEV